ncbi:MAG: SRPBCC family protein [Anaerolineae bacterium]|nr:SRPBCC family protein [Anaerolineae bacterium]
MTILDHRILIPKSPEKIWEFLSDLSQNSAWQVDCKSVSILTTKTTGAGVRWRYTTSGGHSYVAEVTAWYDGLGYEYTFVDGTPFRESKGRIRLQEIAEGTVVQWTLTYETSGMLAGVRNAVGLKRQFESAMVDSLKSLWKVIQKVMPDDKPREVKSLMRDAPDYESRTQYRPRHTPAKPETEEPASAPSFASQIVEPPISADDTRPRAPVKLDSPPVHEEPVSQSESIVSQTGDDPDTGMIEPVVYPLPVEKLPDARDFVPRYEEKRFESDSVPTTRRATQEMQPVVPPSLATTESVSIKPSDPVEVAPPQPAKFEPSSVTSGLDTVKMATGEMSVFELFGLPRPSQTQEINRVITPEPIVETVESLPAPSLKPTRIGLRLVLRRKHVNIRRPI